MTGGSRVSIPSAMRRTIQNIKEMTGNHSDEDVYAMLKECGMDPNETAQKLLLQDTFHEVKRKRDKKKENNRESTDSRRRPEVLGRGGRVIRGGYSSRYVSIEAGRIRNIGAGKENEVNQVTDKGNSTSLSPTSSNMENKLWTSTSSSAPGPHNGPIKADNVTGCAVFMSGPSSSTLTATVPATESINLQSTSLISGDVKSVSPSEHSISSTQQFIPSMERTLTFGVYASASDPVLVPCPDAQMEGAVGAIKHEISRQQAVIEATVSSALSCDVIGYGFPSTSGEVSSELSNSYANGKLLSQSQILETSQLPDTSQSIPSTLLTSSTTSRPSSAYNNRSQQLTGPLKVGLSKEWKPKSTPIILAQPSGILGDSVGAPVSEAVNSSLHASSSIAADVTSLNLEKKLRNIQLSETQHVIIPHHLQVPESERCELSFGRFDASFKLMTGFANGSGCKYTSTSLSESYQEIEENAEETVSVDNESSTAQKAAGSSDLHEAPMQVRENLLSDESEIASGTSPVQEIDQSDSKTLFATEGPPYPVVYTAPTYSTFGLVTQMLGSQFEPFQSTEARDAARLPGFVMQQPFDPSTSYYTQIYRPSADGDGRFSPSLAPGAATKYNGNVAVLPTQTGQSPQESGYSLVLSSAGPTPLATQDAGLVQGSVALTQQPLPIFRQPAGVHISHFPPNYFPYNQYFSPFYAPHSALHHFLSNTVFPQQAPAGSIYPSPTAAAAVKYPASHYKPGANIGNSNHVALPAYGTYNSTPAGYNPSPAATCVIVADNEDLAAAQYKENNVYIAGQQSDGSGVWVPATGRDVSGLQLNSFYNLPQGQHMTFAPAQAGHGAIAGIYHPNPAVVAGTVHPLLQQSPTMVGAEVVGPPAGAYQQPQHAQINWTNSY